MAYTVSKTAAFVLIRPVRVSVFCIGIGLIVGGVFELLLGNNFFERFGSITVALAILCFGTVSSELLVRSQFSFIMDDDGQPAEPFKQKTVRKALSCQTFAAFIGTLQWGFGHLIYCWVQAYWESACGI